MFEVNFNKEKRGLIIKKNEANHRKEDFIGNKTNRFLNSPLPSVC